LWTTLAILLLLGAIYVLVGVLGGRPELGIAGLAFMAVYGVVMLVGGRSEIIRVLRYEPSDERWKMIDLKANVFVAYVTIFSLLGLFFYDLARGGDGMPYAGLIVLVGLSYIAALIWLSRRS